MAGSGRAAEAGARGGRGVDAGWGGSPMLPARPRQMLKCSPQGPGKPSSAGTEGGDSEMGTQARWEQGQLALYTAP